MKTLRILVADDHELVRKGLRVLLGTQAGWQVVGEASDGREAVEKAGQLKPDVVILDFRMPKLNGLDATPLVLKAAPQSQVVIYTMHYSEQLEQRSRKAGARGYVLKADAGRTLLAAVKALEEQLDVFSLRED
jgi:DNA-binding NarL/FixJ family response regulator